MEEEKIKEFNEELQELLKKYNCRLNIEQKIVVAEIPEAKTTGTDPKVAETEKQTSTKEEVKE